MRKGKVATFPNQAELSDAMLKQILSWPSKVHVDEVAAILFEGIYRVLVAQYGDDVDEHLSRAADVAGSRLFGGDGGPTHRMVLAA